MYQDQSLAHAERAAEDNERRFHDPGVAERLAAILDPMETVKYHIERAHELGFWPDYELHHLTGRQYIAFRKDADWEPVRADMIDPNDWETVESRGKQLIFLVATEELTAAEAVAKFNRLWLPF